MACLRHLAEPAFDGSKAEVSLPRQLLESGRSAFGCGAHDRRGAVLDFGGVASVGLPAMGDIRCLSQSYDRANEPAVR